MQSLRHHTDQRVVAVSVELVRESLPQWRRNPTQRLPKWVRRAQHALRLTRVLLQPTKKPHSTAERRYLGRAACGRGTREHGGIVRRVDERCTHAQALLRRSQRGDARLCRRSATCTVGGAHRRMQQANQ